MAKIALVLALFVSSFSYAGTLVCADKDKYTELSAEIVNAESLKKINLSFFGANDYAIDESAQKDKSYKPRKYAGYSRFTFEGVDFESTQSLLLESGFETKSLSKAVLMINDLNRNSKPAIFELSCVLK